MSTITPLDRLYQLVQELLDSGISRDDVDETVVDAIAEWETENE